ncbi:hypothetical protein [Bradyrhizobium liaoningense]|uniref:hypothetical protein n=1 Tax=Bradyrhizobium liaoningense TaxID=43992 RepID=UPI001BA445F4|nr:hypothetical protein [Bradyrhizobium liaoningense]MBR0823748.1 hypothetical protein [Bradyrhizobium liaoningense]
MPKPTPLSAADIAAIATARAFTVQILVGREWKKVGRPTLATARAWGPVMEKEAANSRKAMIHAIADGRAILVPPSYQPDTKAEAKKPTEPVKPKAENPKAPPNAKAAKPAKAKPKAGSKAEIALRMLTASKGTTRAAIIEATGWKIDVKQFAQRKGLKLRKLADGTLLASAKG